MNVDNFRDIVSDTISARRSVELGNDIKCAQLAVTVALTALRVCSTAEPDVAMAYEVARDIYPLLRPYFQVSPLIPLRVEPGVER
jgi:hypothetical protein